MADRKRIDESDLEAAFEELFACAVKKASEKTGYETVGDPPLTAEDIAMEAIRKTLDQLKDRRRRIRNLKAYVLRAVTGALANAVKQENHRKNIRNDEEETLRGNIKGRLEPQDEEDHDGMEEES